MRVEPVRPVCSTYVDYRRMYDEARRHRRLDHMTGYRGFRRVGIGESPDQERRRWIYGATARHHVLAPDDLMGKEVDIWA